MDLSQLSHAVGSLVMGVALFSSACVGDYAGVKFGNIAVHLSKYGSDEYAKPIVAGTVYVFCDEVDSYYAEVKRKGATVKYPPQDTHYGMREFRVADLDGHHLAFGCERKRA